jgi:hypothetical protein
MTLLHSNTTPDLVVTVQSGDRRLCLTGLEIDELFGPPLRKRLLDLLFSRTVDNSASQYIYLTNERNEDIYTCLVKGEEGYQGGEGAEEEAVDNRVARLADYLAERLRDEKSLRFYRQVARQVAPDAILEALTAALDLRPGDIRVSRAAYFTALVLPHLRSPKS